MRHKHIQNHAESTAALPQNRFYANRFFSRHPKSSVYHEYIMLPLTWPMNLGEIHHFIIHFIHFIIFDGIVQCLTMFNSYELIGKGYIHHLRPRLYLDSPGHGLVRFLQSVAVIQFSVQFSCSFLLVFFFHFFLSLVHWCSLDPRGRHWRNSRKCELWQQHILLPWHAMAPWKSWKWHDLNLNPKTE